MKRAASVWICAMVVISSTFIFNGTTKNAVATNDPVQPPDGGTVQVWGDWTVTNTREYHNCTIIMNGNLTVRGNCSLTFHNVTLLMNNSMPEDYIIKVNGNFTISDWDNNKSTTYDSSRLTAPSKEKHYCVWVDIDYYGNGTFNAYNSMIEFAGGTRIISGNTYYQYGIGIEEGGNLNLEGNMFSNCSFLLSGYKVTGGKILNNTFSNFIGPLHLCGCNNCTISGNTFIDSSQEFYNFDIIYFEGGKDNFITDNFISSSFYGSGLTLWNAINCTIKGNNICANGESGIRIAGGMGYGCYHNNIIENNITNNKNGISFYAYNDGTTHNNTIHNNSILGNLAYAIISEGTTGINVNNDARFNFFGTDNQTIIDSLIDGDIDYSNHLPHRGGNFQYVNSTDIWTGNINLGGGVIVNSNLSINSANVTFNMYEPQFIQVNGELWILNSSFSSLCSNYSIVYLSQTKGNIVSTSITGQIGVGLSNEGFVMDSVTFDAGCLGIYSHSINNLTITNSKFNSGKTAIQFANVVDSLFYNLTFKPHYEDIVEVRSSDSLIFNYINTTAYAPITPPGDPWYNGLIFGFVNNSLFRNFNIVCTGEINDAINMWGGHNNKLENIFINSEGDGIFSGAMNNTSIMNTTIMNCWDGMFWRENINCNYVKVSIINCEEGIKGWGGAGYGYSTFTGMRFIENNCAIRFTGFSNITIKESDIMNNTKGFEFTSNYGNYLIYNNNFINKALTLNSF